MCQAKKILPKLFFIVCVVSALVILFVTLVDLEEDKRSLAQKKVNGTRIDHKTEYYIKSEVKIKTEKHNKTKQSNKTEQIVKTEPSIKTELKAKTEPSIKTELKAKTEPSIKTELNVKTDSSIKTELKVKTDSSIKTEVKVKTEASIKTEPSIRSEEKIKIKHNVTTEREIKIKRNVTTEQRVKTTQEIKTEYTTTVRATTTTRTTTTRTTTLAPEIVGWEINVSRDLNHYIRKDNLTATIIPKDFCDSPTFLVIMCISSPSGFEPRKVIRNTWGKDRSVMGHNVSLYFLIGQTNNKAVQSNIAKESLQYKDIVQEDFYDSYNNLSIKSAMMLKLFSTKCEQRANYLLKIDDDIYLNLPRLVDDLLTRNQSHDLLMGSVICGSRPIKDSRDKWYAGPSYLYPYHWYPHYVSGTSYCMSRDVPKKILNVALKTPVFHLEDVYLTGICSKKIGLSLTHNGRFTFHSINENYCLYKPLITIHYQGPDKIRKIHKAISDPAVETECQKEMQVIFVHKWLVEHVLILNKLKRRPDC